MSVELNDNKTGAATVTNTGVIKLQTADGVQTIASPLISTLTVVNSGVIEEYAGASGSRGIVFADFVTNTGQISVGGVGVLLGSGDLQTHQAALTNSGSITSLAGTAVDSGAFASSVSIANQAGGSITGLVYGVEVRQGGTVANAGLISGGQGSVHFLGGGTLILQTGSSLVGDATGAGANALVLQGAGSAGVNFTGFSSLSAQGQGVWTLNGASSFQTTEVASGTLQVGDAAHPGASLSGPILVDSGATLSGHGGVGPVTNNGTVQPGGSIGVLTAQSYTQTASGVLLIQADPTQNSELVVHGPASLAGALHVDFAPGIYRRGTNFEFIDASGGISGGFSSVSTNNGVDLNVSIQGDTAVFDIVQGAAPIVAGGTANQFAIATGFANYPAGVGDFDPVANAVFALPPGPVQNAAFDQLGGEVYADLLTVGRDSARAFLGGMSEALNTEVPEGPAGGPAVWGRAFGSFGHTSSDGNAHGMSDTAEGLIVGVEKDLGPDAVLGASAAYRHTSLSLKGLSQSGALDDAAAGLYAERRWSSLYVRAAVGADHQSQHGDRALDLPGVSRAATGGAGGYALDGLVEAGARLKAGGVTVQPSVTLLYNRIRQDGFTETGAGGADLAVTPGRLNAARTLAGAKVSRGVPTGDGGMLTLDVRAAWAHELDDVTPLRGESFAAVPGTDFVLAGARQNTNSAVVGVGLSFTRGKSLEVFTRYDGDIGHRSSTHAVSLGARLRW